MKNKKRRRFKTGMSKKELRIQRKRGHSYPLWQEFNQRRESRKEKKKSDEKVKME